VAKAYPRSFSYIEEGKGITNYPSLCRRSLRSVRDAAAAKIMAIPRSISPGT
jgi:hypothetical protein